jgi:hypothetical protein
MPLVSPVLVRIYYVMGAEMIFKEIAEERKALSHL